MTELAGRERVVREFRQVALADGGLRKDTRCTSLVPCFSAHLHTHDAAFQRSPGQDSDFRGEFR